MHQPVNVLLRLLLVLAIPVSVHAQALGTIAGVARDPSGGVLPGVTVEVSSPALIEKVRTAVTDGAGQYSVINLPGGLYAVTFTLPGFTSLRRAGVEVLANFTAPVNAEMRVGALEETITVTAESPLIDVQSASVNRAVTQDIIRAVPVGGTMYQLAAMMPGVTMSGGANTVDVGGASGSPVSAQLSAHGGAPGDEVQMLDGIKIGNMQSNAGRTGYTLSPLMFEQVDVQIAGHGTDGPAQGVQSNAVPRSGGNTFSGTFLSNGSGPALQSKNLTERLSRPSPDLTEIAPWGLTRTSGIRRLYDLNGGIGGPIKRDRIWFFVQARYNTNQSYVAGLYHSVDPTARVRVEDTSRQAVDDQFIWDTSGRFNVAVTPKMQATALVWAQNKWFEKWQISGTTSPESVPRIIWRRKFFAGTWTYTATNRLLFDAGLNTQFSPNETAPRRDEAATGVAPRVVETGGTFNGQPVAPITYGSFGASLFEPSQVITAGKASMNYVTGTHNVKAGMDLQTGYRERLGVNWANDIQYRTTAYVLNQVTIFAPEGRYQSNLDYNVGLYAQDRWTIQRATISGGVRFELQSESYGSYTAGPTKYLPNRNISFPAATVVNWKEVNPRFGVSYDLFGTGKTALKASAGRGVQQEGLNTAEALNPATAFATNTARTVNELTFPEGDPRRLNGAPDCDLLNPAANGECGPWLTGGFGSPIPQTRQDAETLRGWGTRPWNWEFSAGIQHELMPRVSIGATYYRRVNGGFLITDNIENTAADFTAFPVVVPTDARLNTSGTTMTVYDINPVLANGKPFNATTNVRRFASHYGNQYQHWDGADLIALVRLAGGTTISSGLTFGRTMTDNCEIVAQLPELLLSAPNLNTPKDYCHAESSLQPQYKMLVAYMLPWGDVRVSGNFQSLPGPAIQAGVIYTGAQVGPALGRPFSGGAAGQKVVNVLEPNTVWGDRLNQLDLRFSKIFRVMQGSTLDANFDIYNAMNSDAALTMTPAYSGVNGGAWLRPTGIIQGRIFKFGVRWDF
jgi:hypothetical protein